MVDGRRRRAMAVADCRVQKIRLRHNGYRVQHDDEHKEKEHQQVSFHYGQWNAGREHLARHTRHRSRESADETAHPETVPPCRKQDDGQNDGQARHSHHVGNQHFQVRKSSLSLLLRWSNSTARLSMYSRSGVLMINTKAPTRYRTTPSGFRRPIGL